MAQRRSRRSPLSIALLLQRLEAAYQPAELRGRFEPVEELVACILSQHTADANSLPACADLRGAYPTWEDLVVAPVEEVAGTIRRAGLAAQKARSIQGCLRKIHDAYGCYSLERLRSTSTGEALAWLQELPGVGPKTASIVVCFALGGDVCPVDTHVHRLALRLHLIGAQTDANRAHTELAKKIPTGMAYRLHVALIEHGRSTCRARSPRCGDCCLADVCPDLLRRRAVSGARSSEARPPLDGRDAPS